MNLQYPARFVTTIVGLLSVLLITACQQQGGPEMPDNTSGSGTTELQITDVVHGDGRTAEAGQKIVVHYTGWLYDPGQPENKGEKFDSSVDRGEPFSFPLGGGRVIRGWDEGVAGMQVGGKRILIIPPEMGYGSRGAGGVIPPNAALMFEVDLLDIQ
jgi:FKBP-type peptidyl-prolyl cis-trans isomerase FkpA